MNASSLERPVILDLIPRDGHVVIEASAGTGKTFTLENLVTDRLLTGAATIEQILVVTFTEKATVELKMRLREKLRTLAAAPDGSGAWRLDPAGRARLEQALLGFDGASISTIHAFCQRILVENAFIHRRLFEQQQVSFDEALGYAFSEALRGELSCNPEFSDYLAAAGLVLTFDRIRELLGKCLELGAPLRPRYRPDELLAAILAYPENASDDDVLIKQLKDAKVNGNRINAVKKHLAALRPLIEDARRTRNLPVLLAQAEAGDDVDYLLKTIGDYPFADQSSRAVLRLLKALVPLEAAVADRLLPCVKGHLERYKKELGLYDFDDMLGLVREGLKGEQGEELAAGLRSRYNYVLIDEFQDTDEVQWDIFRRIFFAPESGCQLCVIGDPKQAIYGFRGADVQTYLRAACEIEEGGGKCLSLGHNFRSRAALIEACNLIFCHAPDSKEELFFSGGISYQQPSLCGDPCLQSSGRLAAAPVEIFALAGEGGKKLSAAATRRLLGQRIAREIRALLFAEPAPLSFGHAGEMRRLQARDIYILTNTAREGYEMGGYLREAGIPHAFYKQEGLFQTEEAEHIYDLLAAIDEPDNASLCCHAWITPFFALELSELTACRDLPSAHPLRARLYAWHKLAAERKIAELLSAILRDSGLLERVLFLADDERALTNYLHILEILEEHAGKSHWTLRELVTVLREWISQRQPPPGDDSNTQRLESERNAVQIMTMHKAKGLEAAVVFIAGGLGPARSGEKVQIYHQGNTRLSAVGTPTPAVKNAIEAEREQSWQRLMYVALTRARIKLYLPYLPESSYKTTQSAYQCVNKWISGAVPRLGDPVMSCLFGYQNAGDGAAAPGVGSGAATSAPTVVKSSKDIIDWRPQITVAQNAANLAAEEHRKLALRHAGLLTTSYSGLKGDHFAPDAESQASEDKEDEVSPALLAPEDDLPRGAATGIFLHELLEKVPLDSLTEAPTLDAWKRLPKIGALIEHTAQRYGISPHHHQRTAELVHTAFTKPISLGDRRIAGLGSAERSLREMEFLYPFPASSLPRLGAPWPPDVTLDRGYIKGFIDLVFRHQGATYVVDWKSDCLASFAADSMAAHVEENYQLQIKLYSLAIIKLLGISSAEECRARFGGLLYCFLRAMRPDDEPGQSQDRSGSGDACVALPTGVYFCAPSWSELQTWDAELRGMRL